MVPNGAAYANYPSFANNGTKTPPGGSTESAKYALGMVPADTFPAEWANYLFHGATAGITRLNQDAGSIKKEINTVLENFNITPDATLNNQLLAALNKLKADAALAAHPVGSLYWTSVNENPAVTFGGGTWAQIKDKFILAAGDTYTNGGTGGAATVTLTTEQMPNHSHSFTPSGKIASESGKADNKTASENSHTHEFPHTHGYTPSGSVDSHTHPQNIQGANRADYYAYVNEGRSGSVKGATLNSDAYNINSGSLIANKVRVYTDAAQPAFHGSAGTTTSQSTKKTGSGSAHSHTAYFTGTAGTTGRTGGPTGATAGQASAHENMPPYIVKYCWERVS
jgi:microcystin-dependent protein